MIYPVILCGGSGTRLWPLSRKSYPKQFANLSGDTSLFQETLKRVQDDRFEAPILMTNSDYRFTVQEQAEGVGVTNPSIIIEPEGRNTAPAILSAALKLENQPDAVMLAMPSDHLIKDTHAFSMAIETAYSAAQAGKLVTFGIKPTRAEIGYGYLEVADRIGYEHASALPLSAFVEKPNTENAEIYVDSGRYLWNAGIFMFKVADILEAFEVLAPKLMMPCRRAVSSGVKDLGFFRLGQEAYKSAEEISIDYAIMELCETLSVVPMDCGWSDMGSWSSVWEEGDADENGVVENGSTTAIDCENTLLRSETDGVELIGLGLKNITAIAMGDAVLVADISQSENVKNAVQKLKIKKAKQAETFPRDHRPWGYFETLSLGERFQVKRIVVQPGAALSLQSHVHRSEHWIVVQGSANVTVNEDIKLVSENESIYIPLGAIHRMENPGKVPLHLIEVQTGAYLGEDDIVRYEDIYARDTAA
ncbi:mannose-1-phosphate guanylyltransferase/mannose-6-phosphate isomerase [Amylibacter sp. SFDW26]|uniref:mannose-1-phosphate guanylyltransferase/mannose-6-phosphate isomerase n=1 Tax=Amylibacter sp. SFDW26 TaxID=2652722 RepID=UPI001261904C|nr:mannose-1-phosphate guanylyltransferase/mannose-6-phosphate isomerase [Amylibacter sp. SFDW26]KAB7610151.1 mannose-1-phosphate guanylyltransferase/mannose-6-phosphate isomerase [Amylibacter sp. SFDW26]